MTTQRATGADAAGRPASQRPSVKGLLNLLRLPSLRRLVGVRLLGALGDGAFQAALAGVVLFSPERQTTPAAIAATFAVLLLPYSIIGPFAGALLDRWSRRQVLVWANVVRCLLVALVAAQIALEAPQQLMFISALLVTGASRFVGSGQSAAMPHTVAVDSLTGANSLATTVGSVSTVIGGGITIGLRAVVGEDDRPMALVTSSVIVFYLIAAMLARQFAVDALGPDETDEPKQTMLAVLQGFWAGLRHVVQRPTVGLAIGLIALVRFCFGLASLIVLLLFQHTFATRGGEVALGMNGIALVLGVSACGLLVGAVSTSALVRHIPRTGYLLSVMVLSALVVAVCGVRFTVPMTLITAFVLGFTYQSAKVCVDTIVQADSDDAHVGRVFALYDTVNNLFYVGAFAVGVLLVPPNGQGVAAALLIAAIYLIAGVGYWIGIHRLRHRGALTPSEQIDQRATELAGAEGKAGQLTE